MTLLFPFMVERTKAQGTKEIAQGPTAIEQGPLKRIKVSCHAVSALVFPLGNVRLRSTAGSVCIFIFFIGAKPGKWLILRNTC